MMCGSQRPRPTPARWWRGAARCGAPAITTRRTTGAVAITRSDFPPTATVRATTRGRAPTRAGEPCMDPTAAPASPRDITPPPEPTPAARLRGDQREPEARPRPGIHGPAHTRKHVRAQTYTAVGERPLF